MKNYFLFLASLLMIFVAKITPFSFMVGSQGVFFSASTSVALLIAQHSYFSMLLFFMLPLKSLSITQWFVFLSNRIPLFFAGKAYTNSNLLVSVFMPLICLSLFVVHPIGMYAWPYTLYWFIPPAMYLLNYQDLFSRALGSVFVAHAVGSVLWIYTHDMSSQAWLALIPIVAIERLLMVFAVLAGECAIQVGKELSSKIRLFCNRKMA